MMNEVRSSADEEPASKKTKTDYTDDYKKLISLMVGCHYVSFQPQTSEISFQSKSEKIKETTERIIGPAVTSTAPIELPGHPVRFPDLPAKPLGDIARKESKSNMYI